MTLFILVTLAVTHLLALVAGGYLHYRFGVQTVRTAKAIGEAFKH